METASDTKTPQAHTGRKLQRVREISGVKQIVLAERTGLSQQYISKLEQSEDIADEILETIAKALGVSAEFIKNFDEEKAIYNIQSNITYQGNSSNNSQAYLPTIHTHPIDQVVELFEKLLQAEKEKVELLTNLSKQIEGLKKGKE